MSRDLVFGSVLLALVVMVSASGVAEAADFTLKPRVFASAAYNDNVEEVDGGKGDYVGTIKPGLSTTYEGAQVLLDLSYDLEFKKYLDGVLSDEFNNYLTALAKVEAVQDRFFIEVRDEYKKVYEDNTRGDRPDGDTSSGTTDQNVFSVKPYLTIPLQERTDLNMGVEFKDIWYSEEGNVDKRNYSAFAEIAHELTEEWQATFGGGYEKQDPKDVEGGYQRYNLLFGTKYSYAENSFIEASVEPTHTDYEQSDASDKQYFPYYLGLTHAFTETLTGLLSTSLDFSEDPQSADTLNKYVHQASIKNAYKRGSVNVGLAYYDYEDRYSVSRTTYWRPSISGNHSMTERLTFKYNTYCDFHSNPDSDKYWFTLLNLDYGFTETATVGLSYRYKMNDQLGSTRDYTSNTIGLTFNWAH